MTSVSLSFQASDGFLFVCQCETGRVIYVADSVTPVLNQAQVGCVTLCRLS